MENQANPKLDELRHSASHLLAAAVLDLFPDTLLTIGPSTDSGFYYDFDFANPLSDTDLPKIEAKMRDIVKSWTSFSSRETSVEEALKIYSNNPYKQELIKEISTKGEPISFYKFENFEDLCRGGHLENPKESLKFFKLTSVAGAYWRGSEKNKMLTRIYGTAFFTQADLDEYLSRLEEAKKRDHRKLGKDLGLFIFSDTVGKGLPLWTSRGAAIRRELEKFIVDEEIKRGYQHVYTPDIAHLDLYRKSGHYPYYKDTMYAPISIEDEEYMLRPMTCPHHFELFLSSKHSYKELPMRIAELAKLYRFEHSGELTGLMRVRSFCLADAHIICADNDQAKSEINGALELIEFIATTFGLKMGVNFRYRLSLGDRTNTEKYYDAPKLWDDAENILRAVLTERGSDFYEAEAEAAFYGPKIDIQMRNVLGKEDTAFTVQYDFVMPGRFNLTYTDNTGAEKTSVVVHRSSIGAIERIVAFLIEHYSGAFPVWLSPTQVSVLPISEKFMDYAKEVTKKYKEAGIRVELDDSNESLGKKIRNAQGLKTPYMLIIGEKEVSQQAVAVRTRDGEDLGIKSSDEFLKDIQQKIATKSLKVI